MNTSITIGAPIDTVFRVLADPSAHAAIDGTGWVRESLDGKPLTQTGQIFRMAMYHRNHPDGTYEMASRVELLDPPHAIAWQPGQEERDGSIGYGGWTWRYDLTTTGPSATEVTLSYDWSAVPREIREEIEFPPFDISHLQNSLKNLAQLAISVR